MSRNVPPEYRAEAEDCFKSTSGRVYGFLLRLTGGDKELSEDLVQETFRKAWQDWDKLRGRSGEARLAWLVRVASNAAVDIFRREKVARENWPEITELYRPDEVDAERQAITSSLMQRFVEVVNRMPPQRRLVAFLHWRCGWQNWEIAEALGITPGRVSQLLAAARRTLRDELGPYVPFELGGPEGGD